MALSEESTVIVVLLPELLPSTNSLILSFMLFSPVLSAPRPIEIFSLAYPYHANLFTSNRPISNTISKVTGGVTPPEIDDTDINTHLPNTCEIQA